MYLCCPTTLQASCIFCKLILVISLRNLKETYPFESRGISVPTASLPSSIVGEILNASRHTLNSSCSGRSLTSFSSGNFRYVSTLIPYLPLLFFIVNDFAFHWSLFTLVFIVLFFVITCRGC